MTPASKLGDGSPNIAWHHWGMLEHRKSRLVTIHTRAYGKSKAPTRGFSGAPRGISLGEALQSVGTRGAAAVGLINQIAAMCTHIVRELFICIAVSLSIIIIVGPFWVMFRSFRMDRKYLVSFSLCTAEMNYYSIELINTIEWRFYSYKTVVPPINSLIPDLERRLS